jgi:peroxidase
MNFAGAHTIGKAHCSSITKRLFNQSATEKPDPNIPPELLKKLQTSCPQNAADTTTKTVQLDDVTPEVFDNQYYKNLLNRQGILYSDEILSMTSGYNADLVTTYATDQNVFFDAFVKSITKMGNISPLTGTDGEIRRKCHEINK